MQILIVCSANRCRSPMASGLLQLRLLERSSPVLVDSAGFGPPDQPVTPETVAVMADLQIDLAGHKSQTVTPALCAEADLLVGMTRQHVIDLVLLDPGSWPRTFSLVDLLRRGRSLGPLQSGADLREWVRRAHGGRQRSSVLSLPVADDIVDPIAQPIAAFVRTRNQLDQLTSDLAQLLAPGGSEPDAAEADASEAMEPIRWNGNR